MMLECHGTQTNLAEGDPEATPHLAQDVDAVERRRGREARVARPRAPEPPRHAPHRAPQRVVVHRRQARAPDLRLAEERARLLAQNRLWKSTSKTKGHAKKRHFFGDVWSTQETPRTT